MTVQERNTPLAAVPASDAGAARGRGFTGSWPSAAAWGAGLVLAAMGAGAIVGPNAAPLGRGIGVILVTLGVLALVWGSICLARARVLMPRLALSGAVVGVVGVTTLLIASPAHTSLLAVAVAVVFLVFVGATAATIVRRGNDRPRDSGTLAGVLGLVVAATILAGAVTPALGSTQDAVLIRDDGTVPRVTHGH